MTAAPNLADATTAAVAALLGERVEIKASEIEPLLPTHVRLGRPSKKMIAGAVKAQGWRAMQLGDGDVLYRAPQLQSDPLVRQAETGENDTAERLRLLLERIERLREEKKALGEDERDVFAEAKATGFDAKTMRRILQLRAMEKHSRDEMDALEALYREALGMA